MMIKQGRIPSTTNIDLPGYHALGYSRMAPSLNEESGRRNKTKESHFSVARDGHGFLCHRLLRIFRDPSCICLLPHETRAIYKYSSQVGNVTCFGSEFAIFEGTSLKNRALCLTAHPCRASNGQARSVPDATGARRGGGGSPMSRKLEVTL